MPCDVKHVPNSETRESIRTFQKQEKTCSINYSGLSSQRPGKLVVPVTLLLLMKNASNTHSPEKYGQQKTPSSLQRTAFKILRCLG